MMVYFPVNINKSGLASLLFDDEASQNTKRQRLDQKIASKKLTKEECEQIINLIDNLKLQAVFELNNYIKDK
jgi:hypothetical protein